MKRILFSLLLSVFIGVGFLGKGVMAQDGGEVYGPVYLTPDEVEALSDDQSTISSSDFRVEVCDAVECEVFGTYVSDQDFYDLTIDTIEVGQAKSFDMSFYLEQAKTLEIYLLFSSPGVITFHKADSTYLIDTPLDQSLLFRDDGYEVPQYENQDGSRSFVVANTLHKLRLSNGFASNIHTLGFSFEERDVDFQTESFSFSSNQNDFYDYELSKSISLSQERHIHKFNISNLGSGTIFLKTPFQSQMKVQVLDSDFHPHQNIVSFPQDYRAWYAFDRNPKMLRAFIPYVSGKTDFYLVFTKEDPVVSYDVVLHYLPSDQLVDDLHSDNLFEGDATILQPGKRIIGDVTGEEDIDIYTFSLQEPRFIDFTFDNIPILETYLLDENYNLVQHDHLFPPSVITYLGENLYGFEYLYDGSGPSYELQAGTYYLIVTPDSNISTVDTLTDVKGGLSKAYELYSFQEKLRDLSQKLTTLAKGSSEYLNSKNELKILLKNGVKGAAGSFVSGLLASEIKAGAMSHIGSEYGSYVLTMSNEKVTNVHRPRDLDMLSPLVSSEDEALYSLYWGRVMQETDLDDQNYINPGQLVTRAEMVQWISRSFLRLSNSELYRLGGCGDAAMPFQDVDLAAEYCGSILHLINRNFLPVIENSPYFSPNSLLTRADAVRLLMWNFHEGFPIGSSSICYPFYEVEQISSDDPICFMVNTLVDNNILPSDLSFRPSDPITRGEFAYLLYAILSKFVNSADYVAGGSVVDLVAYTGDQLCSTELAENGNTSSAICYSPLPLSVDYLNDSNQDDQSVVSQEEPSTPTYSENYPEPPSYSTTGAQTISGASTSVNASQDLFVFTANRLGSHILYSEGNVAIEKAWLFDPLHQDTRVLDYDAEQSAVGQNFRVGGTLDAGTEYYVLVEYAAQESGTYTIKVTEPGATNAGDIGDGSAPVDHLDDLHDFDHEYPEVSDDGYQFWDAGRISLSEEKSFSIHENETAVYSFSLYYDSVPMFFEIKDIPGESGVFLVRDKKTKEFQIESTFSVGVDQFDPTARLSLNQLQAGVDYEMLITSHSGDIQADSLLRYSNPLSFENPGDDVPNIPLYSDAGQYTYEPARILIDDQIQNRFAFQTNAVDVFVDTDMFMIEPDRTGLYEMTMESSSLVNVHVYANCHKQQFLSPQSFTFEAYQTESQTIHITKDFGTYFCFAFSGTDDEYAFALKRHNTVVEGDDYPDQSLEAKILEGALVAGKIDLDGDLDVFSFSSDRTGSYRLQTDFPVEILDMNDQVVHRYSTSTDENIEFFLKKGEEYQFRVTGLQGDEYQFGLNSSSPSYPAYTREASLEDRSSELTSVVFQTGLVDAGSDPGTGRYNYRGTAEIAPGEVQYWHNISIQFVGYASQISVTPLGDNEQQLIGEVVAPNGLVSQVSSPLWSDPNGFSLIPNATGAHYRVYNTGTESVSYTFFWTNVYGDDFFEEEVDPDVVINGKLDPEVVYGRGYRAVGSDAFFFTAQESGVMMVEFHSNTVNADMLFITDEGGNNLQYPNSTDMSYLFWADAGKKYQVKVYNATQSGTAPVGYNFALHALPSSLFSTEELQAMPVSPNILPEITLQVSADDIHVDELIFFDASQSFDADGEIVSYEWEIDGQLFDEALVEYRFLSGGEHSVRLTITDDKGAEITSTINYQVDGSALPSILQIAPNQEVYLGTPVSFDASARSLADGVQRTYEWSLDGEAWDALSGASPLYTFDTLGDFEVSVVLREPNGNFATDSVQFTVSERPDGDGTPELATPVTFSSYNQNGYGLMYSASVGVQSLDFAGDVDYFVIIPPAAGTYSMRSWSNNNFDVRAEFLDEDQVLFQSDDNGSYGNAFTLSAALEAGKRYYVRTMASDADAIGEYGMNIQRLMDDHGNYAYDPTPLEIGSSISAQLCSYAYGSCSYGGDHDYFMITPETTGEYIIGTSGFVPFKVELIEDISQYYTAYSNGTGPGNNVFLRRTLQAGQTYYLGLRGMNMQTTKGNYEVFVMQEKDDHPDVSAAATALAPNTVINAQIDTVDDVDWFGVSQPGPGSYQLMLTGAVSAEMLQQGATQVLPMGQLFDVDPSLGSIQIRVSASAVGSYSIELKKQNLDDHANDGAGATRINRYQYVSGDIGAVGDIDVFEYIHNGYSCQYLTVESYGSTNVMMSYYGYVASMQSVPWHTYSYWTAQFFDWDSGTGGNFRKQIYACPGNHMYIKVSHQQNQTGAYQIRMY